MTLRFETIAEPGAWPPPPPACGIWCFWHQCAVAATLRFNRYKATIMISRSFDGELIARTLAKFGFPSVRGSSSRGGPQALLGLKAVLEEGKPVVFTADGPRGPIYKAKTGPVKLAQITGRPAGAFYLLPERAFHFRSWDRFALPLPFSRVIESWALAVKVEPESDDATLEAKRQELETALERARLNAEEHLRRTRRGGASR